MARRFQFDFLLKLAADRRETAARHMQEAAQRLAGARERQQQIDGFREEYRRRFTDSGQRGINMTQYRDFQLFLAKLDTAVEQQSEEVARCEARMEQARQAFLEQERSVKAFEALETRHQHQEVMREAKREQKLSDEWASKSKETQNK
ncbi:flagellar export protein FliJ [Chitinimonas lacunae]|uniref:Flagellar FliJ protein n=1 Tax=Chitinimonas lacunae TaxID=1963018 RepID=A0ABV8MX10_9NEIS